MDISNLLTKRSPRLTDEQRIQVIQYNPKIEMCHYNNRFKWTCFYFTIVFTVVYTIYIILIRNIQSSFNELREAIIVYIAGTSMVLIIVIMHLIVDKYPLHRATRISSAAIDTVFIITPMWLLLTKPVYMCLFHRDEYLEKWVQKLADDGLARVYKLQDGQVGGVSTNSYSRMENSRQYMDSEYNHGSEGTISNETYMSGMHSAGNYAQHGHMQPGFGYSGSNNGNKEHGYSSQHQFGVQQNFALPFNESTENIGNPPRRLV
ncbi:hypothetical protein GGI12_004748 [Dipsacomyces acuminosporus]|nr:hypothetical protein GGI12_004748 [Dipsacomyces acuminosporus]